MCPICRGRGEVAAGISFGIVEHGPIYPDERGRPTRACYPTEYAVSPYAWDSIAKDVWLLEDNPFGKLWGIAVCVTCHGTGNG